MSAADPLAPGFALACRACGAPRDPGAGTCAYCGASVPYDDATRARLAAHRARMRRALQMLRALVTSEVSRVIGSGQAYLIAGLFFVVPIGAMVAGLSGPLLLILVLQPKGALAVALVLTALAGASVGLAAGFYGFYQWVKRHAEGLRQQARSLVLAMEAVTPVVCPQCGGHASVVALGPEEHAPCPWCGAPLVPAASTEAAVRQAAHALIGHHEDAARKLGHDLGRRHRLAPKPAPVAGFEVLGGTVVKGATHGVPVRAFNELYEGAFVFRLEVPADTGLSGEVLLVRSPVERTMRAMAREWGYALPGAAAPSPRDGWLAYADDAAVPSAAILGSTLDKLGPSDAVLLDPAGLSLWRSGDGLSYAWSLVREHHETVAALARALRGA